MGRAPAVKYRIETYDNAPHDVQDNLDRAAHYACEYLWNRCGDRSNPVLGASSFHPDGSEVHLLRIYINGEEQQPTAWKAVLRPA